MFEDLIFAPADPILGLTELYQADQRANKINLGIGVYKNEKTQTPILNCVKRAEAYLLENQTTKNYLSIEGFPEFTSATQALFFGEAGLQQLNGRARTAQAPGGTGALRIIGDFLAKKTKVKRIWVSSPSWPNHKAIFESAGIEVREYQYYDPQNHNLNFDGMLNDLSAVQTNDAVLFHGCCHNPTGIDPTPEQWQILSDLSLKKGWLPVFDLAYQGFGDGLEEDVFGLRLFAQSHPEMLIASSYSKNFGIYNERVGAFTLIAQDKEIADRAFSQARTLIRANYSNPPAHGAMVISHILNTPELKAEWIDELTQMRQRIHTMRELFVKMLVEKRISQDFSFIIQQKGMFSFSGLTEAQVLKLRDEFGIYMVNNGRMNVAGMTLDNLPPLCEAVASVLKSN